MSIQTKASNIDWAQIKQRLATIEAAPTSRIVRTLKAPIKTGTIVGLRKLGQSRAVSMPLIWGDRFLGHVPEAVSSVIWRQGVFEPTTTRYVIDTLKPDDVFVDIGAHFGYFTLLASRLVGPSGKVVAIEAMTSTFEQLSKNVRHNGLENVEVHNAAAYSEATTLTFKDFGLVHSSLNTAFEVRGVLEGKTAKFVSVDVQARRADDILAPLQNRRVALIKIDAESSEEFVLQGLSGTLGRSRPDVLLELGGAQADDLARIESIVKLLFAQGHHSFRLTDGRLVPVVIDSQVPYDNYIFRHPDRV
ncbi:MAG: FkbM family methyltransferase [Hyphomicrobiaceae bacterium]|nr:FkbM family methyltransferase [Hyphomicrobiaceae bacterium]